MAVIRPHRLLLLTSIIGFALLAAADELQHMNSEPPKVCRITLCFVWVLYLFPSLLIALCRGVDSRFHQLCLCFTLLFAAVEVTGFGGSSSETDTRRVQVLLAL